ncbi:telomeric repeat binding factor a isoform X3 [Pagrus major]|uniref:telomeric repeat binding factor a isoform X3 n=1 Tax=Pagrus major TaxID=143350 RepID=UPI003CC85EDE
MAANESVNSQLADVESLVTHWFVDYYVSLALELFQKELYADFRNVIDVTDSVLDRPCEDAEDLQLKIQVLKFLSRINEGENLGELFGPEESSPLESALLLLKEINQENSIPQQDFENVCTSLKEMTVVIFMKNNEFGKAKEVLNTHFPKQMVGKKAIFMGLIRKKSKTHEVIEQSDFQRFKKEMLAFCRRLCPVDTPFLLRAAMLYGKRLTEADNEAAGPDVQEEPGPSSCPPINTGQFALRKYTISQRTRLEAAYKDLAAGLIERTFAQLEEEVEREGQASLCLSSTPTKDINRDSEQDGLFQRASGSPMEASPADQPPQMDVVPETQAGSRSKTPSVLKNRRLFTVARLVVEPDSQQSCQSTPASQDLENEVRTEEPQSPSVPSNKQPQSPLTDSEVDVPTRKRRRRANQMFSRNSTKSRQLSSDSEEDPQESPASYKTAQQTPRKQPANDPLSESRTSTPERISDCIGRAPPKTHASGRGKSTESNQMPSDSEEDPQASVAPRKTPVQKPRKQLANDPPSRDPDDTDEVHITDSSSDISPNPHPHQRSPQTCSTPHKDTAKDKGPTAKWKELFYNAKETKERWSDEETYFISKRDNGNNGNGSHDESNSPNSGHKKRRWTERETQKLKEGVQKFGEGNWNKIKSYYSFRNRSNINLKDRWRTMKKLNMV